MSGLDANPSCEKIRNLVAAVIVVVGAAVDVLVCCGTIKDDDDYFRERVIKIGSRVTCKRSKLHFETNRSGKYTHYRCKYI